MFKFAIHGFGVFLFFSTLSTITCKPKIVIVGAGASGIAAATKLLKNNITNVVILEAENRIGGRINSVKFGDAIVDLGAEWCHGENIVYDMAKDLNVISLRNQERTVLTSYYSNGNRISDSLNKEFFRIVQEIQSADDNRQDGLTLADFCQRKYREKVSELKLDDNQANLIRDFLPLFEKLMLSLEGAFSWVEPSAVSDFEPSQGRMDWTWSGLGYKTILEILMQKYPNTSTPLPIDDKFLLNKEVQKITWDDTNDTVSISCSDNSTYAADFVIFTPSIGVLKKHQKTLFEPKMPTKKIRAIETIGFGAVMKVILRYKEAWWPVTNDFSGFSFVWSEQHRSTLSGQDRSWLLAMTMLLPVQNNPHVVTLWFLGPNVPLIEKMEEMVLLDGINHGLKLFLGREYNVTEPEAFIRSQWYTNDHFLGTYSYQTVGSRGGNSNVELSKPLVNKNGREVVFFAGESTNPIHFSTVHGAIETGFREADRLINLNK